MATIHAEGTRIYYGGDMANESGFGVIATGADVEEELDGRGIVCRRTGCQPVGLMSKAEETEDHFAK